MNNLPELFGSMVFNDSVMRQRLPRETYKAVKKAIAENKPLDVSAANVVASVMKDWAVEKGVTHFTHWFQPMTGITAEKHDSFISPTPEGGIIMEFSGKELVQGEPDASSFPSGGIRATFEARGYTAWDPTSFAFIKDNSLCIPTAFCSYTGEALDKKTPLLRSMEALDVQALRILRLFGNTEVKKVHTTVGPEQEYFLIDQALYAKRKDLIFCGRTLFGAKPPKGQELEDHYFGAIKPRIAAFMSELDEELWKLGVLAKTEHNEVAPCQHELAPIFTTANVATDHNQITMELMKKIAEKHGLTCLLHEKPFAGINGSGKHNNWSLATDSGVNLLEPGESPSENAQFLLFLVAVIKAIDKYQELIRVSVATAGNDHRLGANEAPPAIVSVFLGDELTAILDAIESGKPYGKKAKQEMKIGVNVLPRFHKDTTDRNRTSPFAFTGNKFEFRMVGSSLSIAGPNFILNTITSDVLQEFADKLEGAKDFTAELNALIKETIKTHKRIIFNGNGYDESWVKEAAKRGLANLKTAPEAIESFIAPKNVEVLTKFGVLTEKEVHARYEIVLENYCKILNIEVLTMTSMIKKDILPAVFRYAKDATETALKIKSLSPAAACEAQTSLVTKLSALADELWRKNDALENELLKIKEYDSAAKAARAYAAHVVPLMQETRAVADEIEPLLGEAYLPFPVYADLLFRV